ncbi:DNA oxidative demethylase AlkB [Variovorax sp. KK3]|uniref:DNA oxidative demethylase AlkB n=1 Tax=Variovorax sp. KK3 TaxID=1855728 RepID=UPI00097BF7C4|nr:DNA oxidative demethylase AlkB [Variovorax sp. KK3]
MTTPGLFDDLEDDALPATQALASGAVLLRGFARARAGALLDGVSKVLAQAPLRHLVTPGGFRMSVAMSNCGPLGWVSDRSGYRYDANDPDSGRPWPAMPEVFAELADSAARAGGFDGFAPDACLINRYEPGTRLSLHQDRDEGHYDWPIVSVSLGLPAVFLFGGGRRSDKAQRVPLVHGDVVVWGGPSRLHYHGVLPVKDGVHPMTGACRINLTFRKAG